jgi:hypothetical protein
VRGNGSESVTVVGNGVRGRSAWATGSGSSVSHENNFRMANSARIFDPKNPHLFCPSGIQRNSCRIPIMTWISLEHLNRTDG